LVSLAIGMGLETTRGVIALAGLLAAVQLSVPFVPQEKDTCGAASLAMVLRYWGLSVTHDEIAAAVLEPGRRGIAGSRLEAFARAQGAFALGYEGDLDQLRAMLEKGRPIIVALATGRGLPHDVVVTGLDDAAKVVVVHDPFEGPDRRLDLAAFDERWRGASRWTLLVVPGR
jgi:ABC-type bacteriocin/lantibiotic exporter with double-glycine peptidase domain